MATLKSRVSELEGSLNFAQENTNKVRQQALIDQEKLAAIMKEVKLQSSSCCSYNSTNSKNRGSC